MEAALLAAAAAAKQDTPRHKKTSAARKRLHDSAILSETSSDSDSDVDSGDDTDDERVQQSLRTNSHTRKSLGATKKRKVSPKRPLAESTAATSIAVSAADDSDDDVDGAIPLSRKVSSRQSVGLRHFSVLVCQKLAKCQTTSYNIIADQLIAEAKEQMTAPQAAGTVSGYDEKNIRRRIYDALNVLMAVGIITKNKKMIFWNGPAATEMENVDAVEAAVAIVHGNNPSFQEIHSLQRQLNAQRNTLAAAIESVQSKRADLADLAYSFCAKRYLISRNQKVKRSKAAKDEWSDRYLMIAIDKDTTSQRKHDIEHTQYYIKFSSSYTIYDHTALTSMYARYHNMQLSKRVPKEIADCIDRFEQINAQVKTHADTNTNPRSPNVNIRRAHSLPLMSPPHPLMNRLPQSTPTVPLYSPSPYTRSSIYTAPTPPANVADASHGAGLFSPAMPLWTNRATPQSSTRLFTSQQALDATPMLIADKPADKPVNDKSSLITAH